MLETLHELQTSVALAEPEHFGSHRRSEIVPECDVSMDSAVVVVTGPISSGPTVAIESASVAPDPVFDEDICKPVSYRLSKRAFDLFVAAFLLMLAWPIMAVAAVLVWATSRGPVIFCQTRVGRGGRPFTCFKFRSMCVDAESLKDSIQHLNELDGPVFKIRRDPRITAVGRFIRRYSIDELPQLFNVLKGEMSIVGPRPPIPAEVVRYTARERGRLAVQPGLTCLWQVSGRSDIPFEKWIDLDLKYIEEMSLLMDVGIVVRTIPAVLTGSGAH